MVCCHYYIMIDPNAALLTISTILTALFTYLIARKKNSTSETISTSKLQANIQIQALDIVRGVMDSQRVEFSKELEAIREDTINLKKEIVDNKHRIALLENQLVASDSVIDSLKSQIHALQSTISLYQEEILRLKHIASQK